VPTARLTLEIASGRTYSPPLSTRETVLREAGREIPADVAVVGFDDSASAVSADPPLTTIHQPFEQSAAEAVRVLNELIAGLHTEPQHVLMPTKLVCRESA